MTPRLFNALWCRLSNWIAFSYPDGEHRRTLMLYELATGRRIDINKFYSPPELAGEIRCDLHPRWSRDGRRVSIDSAHSGERQIYVLDVSAITGA